ncbi:MAG TPA: molybdopterin-binding protein [Kineosporiaceae bacterium]
MTWARARELAAGCVTPVSPRGVPLAAALGAVLAEDARARSDLPQADTSAMDGWAVAGDPPWQVAGAVLAGSMPPPLRPGTALGIATGALVPPGADGVLRREHGHLSGSLLTPSGGPVDVRGLDLRRAATECRLGDVVLPAGARIGPVALGLLAAAGLDAVRVRRPAVDLLVLGDELLDTGPARDGCLRDALGPLLSAWLPAAGLALAARRRVPDTVAALALALRGCLADVVVTTGSTARGPVDHLHAVLADAGARLVVDGVDIRPGHPQLLAVLPDGRPVVGLPGNPLAAVSGVLTLLEPVAATLAGLDPRPAPGRGVLVVDVPAGSGATRLVPVRGGRPVLFAGPAMLRGLAAAEAVAVIPPGGAPAGTEVILLALP